MAHIEVITACFNTSGCFLAPPPYDTTLLVMRIHNFFYCLVDKKVSPCIILYLHNHVRQQSIGRGAVYFFFVVVFFFFSDDRLVLFRKLSLLTLRRRSFFFGAGSVSRFSVPYFAMWWKCFSLTSSLLYLFDVSKRSRNVMMKVQRILRS